MRGVLCGIGLISVIVLLTRWITLADTAPRIALGESVEARLGVRPADKPIEVKLQLVNLGSSIVEIQGSQSSCACTTARPLPSHLNPNESVELAINIDTRGRHGDSSFRVIVLAEDRPPTVIVIRADLSKRLPTEFAFGNVKRGVTQKNRLSISQIMKGESVRIVDLSYDHGYFDVTPEISRSPAYVDVALVSTAPAGGFDKYLDVTFDIGAGVLEKERVTLTGWVERPVETLTRRIDFGDRTSDETTRRISFYSPYQVPFEFVRLESDTVGPIELVSCVPSADRTKCDFELKCVLDGKMAGVHVSDVRFVFRCDGREEAVMIECMAGAFAQR
jgi:hypothetical protein